VKYERVKGHGGILYGTFCRSESIYIYIYNIYGIYLVSTRDGGDNARGTP